MKGMVLTRSPHLHLTSQIVQFLASELCLVWSETTHGRYQKVSLTGRPHGHRETYHGDMTLIIHKYVLLDDFVVLDATFMYLVECIHNLFPVHPDTKSIQ